MTETFFASAHREIRKRLKVPSVWFMNKHRNHIFAAPQQMLRAWSEIVALRIKIAQANATKRGGFDTFDGHPLRAP